MGRAWVIGTVSLICFIAYSSQIFIILPSRIDRSTADLIRLLLPFNVLVACIFVNYALCVRTDPGRVSPAWLAPQAEETNKRYCRACKAYKPPRAHHCKQCKRCTLRMDHHCPWTNNCVGFANYGHFIRFLFFVDIACAYHLCMITQEAFGVGALMRAPTPAYIAMIVANYVACLPVIFAVGLFSLYHFWCLATNTTTIESWEKSKAKSMLKRGRIKDATFPFSLGIWRNVQSVLGGSPLLWCWPQSMDGDGHSFPVMPSLELDAQHKWPPRDEFSSEQQPGRYSRYRVYESHARKRKLDKSSVPPYHPDYVGATAFSDDVQDSASDSSLSLASSDEGGELDDDDVPLASYGRGVRVRRGSEGFEVRPRSWSSRHTDENLDPRA